MSISASSIWSSNFFILLFLILFYFIRKSKRYLHINVHFILASFILCICRLAVPVEFSFTKTIFFTKILPYFTDFIYGRHHLYGIQFSFGQVFILIWVFGCLLKSWKHIQTYQKFRRWKRLSSPYDMDLLFPVLNRLDRENILPPRITFFQIPAKIEPFCSGIRHPAIFLPQGVYTQDELYYIVRHEIAHLSRHDLILKAFAEAVCVIYWWNPLVYCLRNDIFRFIELSADRDISKNMDSIQIGDYTECLLKCAKECTPFTSYLQAGISESSAEFTKLRFSILLRDKSNEAGRTNQIKNSLVILLTLVVFFSSIFLVFNSTNPRRPTDFSPTMFSIGRDDVYAIITPMGYDVYVNGQKAHTLKQLPDSLDGLIPIYNSISEVSK